ncbi:acyl carrier protein 1, chloroplastic-like isoform X1 [Elaeis guineensis]|uniref:acyl carrier protein 1, chloroplastic-like isoform X1 n=1 Tax=Elaeis guineensis var. tenera TaxID=51953 RepID=UPI003C6DA002
MRKRGTPPNRALRARRPPEISPPVRSLPLAFSLSSDRSMASISGTVTATSVRPRLTSRAPVVKGFSGLKSVSFSIQRNGFPSVRLQAAPRQRRFQVSCAQAKPETVQKVCEIVKKQLALSDDTPVSGESKFSTLGADSLDTVEIVMGLEEAFGISVEEESAQSITTVQDAADLIEKLVEAKSS